MTTLTTTNSNNNDSIASTQSLQSCTLKRLLRDVKVMQCSKANGISASPLADNMMVWHAQVQILNGIYEGCNIHLVIKIPENYPFSPPHVYIANGQGFDRVHHSHVYNNGDTFGLSICNDMTANFQFHFKEKVGYGWSPGTTLEDLLINMQVFLSDPDQATPTNDDIENLKKQLATFQCTECTECSQCTCAPATATTSSSGNSADSSADTNSEDSDNNTAVCTSESLSKLMCSITKDTYHSNNQIILGYPLLITKDSLGRMHITPILELISYDAFMMEIQKHSEKLDSYDSIKFRSATGHYYNHWIPIYLNQEHFERSRVTIQNALTVIRYGVEGKAEYDFTPEIILNVIPTLLNKTILALIKKDIHGSTNAIEAYGQFLHLFMAYLEIYPELYAKINAEIENFKSDVFYRHKKQVPDLGEFIIKLFFSSKFSYADSELKRALVDEHFARQMYWVYKEEPTYQNIPITADMLPRMFQLKEVSCKMMAFNFKAAEYFIKTNQQDRLDMKHALDQNYGFPSEEMILDFQKEIDRIEKLSNYTDYLKLVQWDSIIRGTFSLCQRFNDAKEISNRRGYTKVDPTQTTAAAKDWTKIRGERTSQCETKSQHVKKPSARSHFNNDGGRTFQTSNVLSRFDRFRP